MSHDIYIFRIKYFKEHGNWIFEIHNSEFMQSKLHILKYIIVNLCQVNAVGCKQIILM